MSNSPIIQINVKKTHLMAIAILLLIGAATSTVNIRDTTKMFDRLDMDGNPITNLQDPTSAQHAATKSYVDSNVGGGGITDGSSLNWYKCADKSSDGASCSVSCPSDESLIAKASKSGDASRYGYSDEDEPSWYDTYLAIDTGSTGGDYSSGSDGGRVFKRSGTEGDGVSVSNNANDYNYEHVTATIACKP